MPPSLILQSATRLVVPVMLLFSARLLIVGHYAPGGGFAGGLMAAGAYSLYAIAYGIAEARQALPLRPVTLLGIGLSCSLLSGIWPVMLGRSFLEGLWTNELSFSQLKLTLGTPLLFDVGVYFVVVGAILMVVFELEEVFARNTGEAG